MHGIGIPIVFDSCSSCTSRLLLFYPFREKMLFFGLGSSYSVNVHYHATRG